MFARLARLHPATILGIVFALAVGTAALLKTRQLAAVAQRAEMLPAGFALPKSHFDRAAFEASPGCEGADAQRKFLLAVQMHQLGDDLAARKALLRLLAREPDWARARFQLGVVQLRLGYPMAAADELRRTQAGGFRPEGESLEWWLAVAEIYNGRPDEARTLLAAATVGPRAESARELLQRLDDIR